MVCTHLYIYNIYIQNIRIFFVNTYTIRTNTYVPLKIRMCLVEILYVFPVRIRTYLYVFVRIFVRIAYVLRTYSYVSYVFVRIFCRNPVGRSFTDGYGRRRTIRTNTYRNTYEYVRKYVRIRTNTYDYVRDRFTGFRQGTYVFLGVHTYSYVLCTYFQKKYV